MLYTDIMSAYGNKASNKQLRCIVIMLSIWNIYFTV